MSICYSIDGGTSLHGTVHVSGSKNAALPLLAGAAIINGVTTFHNVPDLRDITNLLTIFEYLEATVTRDGSTVTIDASTLQNKSIPHELVSKLRGSIVLLGPLLARFGTVEMAYPGGCVLGKRPVGSHIDVLTQLGAENKGDHQTLKLTGTLANGRVLFPEFSVTATENALLAAALVPGKTTLELAALEPHVLDVVRFIEQAGCTVIMNEPHQIIVESPEHLHTSMTHTIIGDYLEAGAFLIAGLITKGCVTVTGVENADLRSFLLALKRTGAVISEGEKTITADGTKSTLSATKIQTNIFPGFPTDLQAPFGVLMTQASGVGRIFEILFEGRMAYLYELEKMGAHIEILNAHQALVIGPTPLRGRTVQSNDIRAGVAMVLAGLIAEGTTTVTDIQYIERGYDRLEEKLRSLGAKIVKKEGV